MSGARKPGKRRPAPTVFDVGEFLRPTDEDLRSALNSLLGSAEGMGPSPSLQSVAVTEHTKTGSGINLTGGINLDPVSVGMLIALPPHPEADPDPKLGSGINLIPHSPVMVELEEARSRNLVDPALGNMEQLQQERSLGSGSDLKLRPAIDWEARLGTVTLPASASPAPSWDQARGNEDIATLGLKLKPDTKKGPDTPSTIGSSRKRSFAVRRATCMADGHSRAEQMVYEAIWKAADPQEDGTRILTIGFLSLGRLAGLSESNARINLRSLIRKLAVEQHSTYVCEQSTGYTWRIYSSDAVFSRREAAGLIWYAKRTLAVVFVDPQTQEALSR